MAGTLVVAGVALAFYLTYRFEGVILSLFAAIVLALAIRPAVDWLQQHGIPRGVAAAFIFLLLFGFLVGVVFLFAPLVSEQGANILNTLLGYYRSFVDSLRHSSSYLIRQLALQLPASIQMPGTQAPGAQVPGQIPAAPAAGTPGPSAGDQAAAAILQQVSQLFRFGDLAFRYGLLIFAVLLLTFYWILESDLATRSILLFFAPDRREAVRAFVSSAEEKLGAYIRGLLILSLTVGVVSGVAYLIIGLPQALLLGIIAGLMEAIPLVGPFLGAVPPLLLALALDPSRVLWVIVAAILIQQAEGHLLVPRVMDRAVGVNPVVSLLSLAAFSSLFGIGGALLAIPFAVVIQLILNQTFFSATSAPTPELPGRSEVSLLRYEARELIQDIHKQVREKEAAVTGSSDRVEDAIEAIVTDLDSILALYEPPETEVPPLGGRSEANSPGRSDQPRETHPTGRPE
jgi:predicted PurR-regulated permease PerM